MGEEASQPHTPMNNHAYVHCTCMWFPVWLLILIAQGQLCHVCTRSCSLHVHGFNPGWLLVLHNSLKIFLSLFIMYVYSFL